MLGYSENRIMRCKQGWSNLTVVVGSGPYGTLFFFTYNLQDYYVSSITPTNTGYPLSGLYNPVDGKYIIVGLSSVGLPMMAISSDGINWTALTDVTSAQQIRDVKYLNGVYHAVGGKYPGRLFVSSDAVTWSYATTDVFVDIYSIDYNGNMFVAVGSGTNSIAYSYDGINWTGLGSSIFSTGWYISYSQELDMFVAVGSGTNSIAYSYDGINWIGLGSSIFSTGYGVKFIDGTWFACGSGGVLAYSDDGIAWSSISLNFDIIYDITIKEGMYIVGGSGTNRIAYSEDFVTWNYETVNNQIDTIQVIL